MTALHIPDFSGNATLKWSLTGKVNPLSCSVGYNIVNHADGPGAAADSLYVALTAAGGPCHNTEMLSMWTFIGVECIQMLGGGIPVGGASSGPPVVGTKSSAGGRMIVNTSLIVKKLTARVGRHYRGRFYWPVTSMSEGECDQLGMWDPTSLATFQALIATFLTATLADGTVVPVVLHHDATLTPTPITSLLTEGQAGTQRRRMR